MRSIKFTWVILLVTLSGLLKAQQLQQPLEEVPMSNKGYVLLKSGEQVEGRIMNTSSNTQGITQVTLKNEQGEKQKFKSQEIEEFLIAMNDAVRFQFANERGSSVKKLLTKKQPTAVPSDYIIYRNVSRQSGKDVLLQLLNPDFDEYFQVFFDPQARKTTSLEGELITWTGDKHRVFLISKNDGPLLRVKKGSYKKDFLELFGECNKLLMLPKPDFNDLDKHILLYQENCVLGVESRKE
jgi:hypothetical protein